MPIVEAKGVATMSIARVLAALRQAAESQKVAT
jgi:hypothetical protein